MTENNNIESNAVALRGDEVVNKLTNSKVETGIMLAQEMLKLVEVAKALHASGMYPNLTSPAAYYAVIQYGRELGLNPMNALQRIVIISGKPYVESEVMLACARRDGVKYNVVEETDEKCIIEFTRGDESYTSTFTIKEAERAKLLSKDNWKMYPKDMLFHRAVARGVRRISPNSSSGMYLMDEIDVSHLTEVKPPKPIKGEIDINAMSAGNKSDHQDIANPPENDPPVATETATTGETQSCPPNESAELKKSAESAESNESQKTPKSKPASKKSMERVVFLRENKKFDSQGKASLAMKVDRWIQRDNPLEDDAEFFISQMESLEDLVGSKE